MKYVINYNKVKYALSEEQYQMLLKITIRAKDVLDGKDRQRITGLIAKDLFWPNAKGNYKRTELGSELLKAYKQREKARAKGVK